jgi:hypothetical protein
LPAIKANPLRGQADRARGSYYCPTEWIPEEASSAQPFSSLAGQVLREAVFKILRGFVLFAIGVGLMKLQRGSIPVMGKVKTGGGRRDS